jgi:cyclopropane-fatty-acyl-phospholipid synthase
LPRRAWKRWTSRRCACTTAAHALAGKKRTRIWRLYLAGCAHAFARNWISIHQVLAVKSANPGRNPLPWTRDYMYR